MGDIDAGTVKATVRIVLEDEGTQQAEERLNSLKAAAGDAGEAVAGAGENFAQFEEQALAGADGAKTFSSAISELPKITDGSTAAVSDLTAAMAEQQSVVEDTASAFEEARKPVEAYNEGLQGLSDTVSNPHFTENMSAFQDALQNPYPWDMLQTYLDETGQSWTDFGSSLTGENAAILQGSLSSGKGLQQVFAEMSASNQAWSSQFGESSDSVATGFNTVTNATSNLKDQFEQLGQPSILNTLQDLYGGVGFGPEEGLVSPGVMLSSIEEPLAAIDSSLGGALGSTFENMGSMFGGMGMGVMMGAQMAIMAAAQLGQGIYNMAALAEGPAAHSMGSFTGTIDAFGQTAQVAAERFSEGFGRQVIPNIEAMNYQLSQSGGTAGDLGGALGGTYAILSDLAQGAAAPLFLMNPFTAGAGLGMIQSSYEGLINQGAYWMGMPMPFQGPSPVPQAQASYEQQFIQMPQTIRAQTYQTYTQSASLLQMASDPGYLASQDQLTAAQQIYQRAQASYDASHPVNQAQLLREYQYRQYADSQGPPDMQYPSFPQAFSDYWGPIFGGIGKFLTQPIPAAQNYPGLQSMGASNFDFSGITGDIGHAFSSIHLPNLDLSGIASQVSGAFSNLGSVGSGFHIDLTGITSGISSQLSAAFSSIGNISASLPSIDLSGLANIGSTISSSLSGLSNIGASIHIPDIGSMISGALSSLSSISVPNIGGMLNGAIEGMFAGIGIPKPPDIGAMLTGAMDGMFSGIQLPTIPQLGAMLTGAMSGMFAGIQLPQIPNLGAALSGAMSVMFGSASSAIPGFAGGVSGFSGGPAVVGEGASIEAVSYNGQYALFNQATLVNLPPGASVYPLQDLSAYSFSNPSGQGGGMSPISLGGGGGGSPQSINLVVQLDSQSIISAIGLPLSQNVRVASGFRGY